MTLLRIHLWSLLFALAVAVLMLAILLIRSTPVEPWVLVVYPIVGAVLAQMASSTNPNAEDMAWIETGTIAAAAVLVLAALVNVMIARLLLQGILGVTPVREIMFYALPAVSALLWLALNRRLARLRQSEEAGGQAERRHPGGDGAPHRRDSMPRGGQRLDIPAE